MRLLPLALTFAALAGTAPVSAAVDPAPPASPSSPGTVDRTILHVQVILDRLGFSPGVLDGRPGQSLTNALNGFQMARGLKVTGAIDAPTLRALYPYRALRPTVELTLTDQALGGPYTPQIPDAPDAQAKLPQLGYRSPMEKLAEMFHTTPETLLALNSAETRLSAGTKVVFPNALPSSRDYPPGLPDAWRATLNALNVDAREPQAAKVIVDRSDGVLRVFDADFKLVAQFTATMGSAHDPLPIGSWTVQGEAYNPPFHWDPDLFWTASPGAAKVTLPPGPNGPVGVLWIDLSKPHYGIQGTAEPTAIGRAESRGCIRLTNWDVARLSLMVKPGTPVVIQP